MLVIAILLFCFPPCLALAEVGSGFGKPRNGPRSELIPGDSTVYFGPIKPNAYGPAINADATGRAFQWQPRDWPSSIPDTNLKVTPNVWGQGVQADQWGRIVKPVCPFGESVC